MTGAMTGGLHADLGVIRDTFELDVHLDVAPGEVLAILGPNGAGKTTIVRALAGLAPLHHGRIHLGGDVLDAPGAPGAPDVFVPPERRPVGVVFQDYLLFDHLSVLDNVAFGLRARGMRRTSAAQRASAELERVGMAEYADRRPRQLSGGQAQRVALARALATSPQLLLMDEPLAALDVATRAEVRRDLRRHLESFGGVRILVTHDPVDAHALAHRVMIVEDGRVVQSGTLDEIAAHPRSPYVARLVGVNLVAGTVRASARGGGELHTDTGAVIVLADAPLGPAYAVIHPHSVTLTRAAPQGSSARNIWPGVITDIDRMGHRLEGRARVRVEGPLTLTAEITVRALDEMGLVVGAEVHATVKATDIEVRAR